jgi:non-ribosomal peptide synthase protein (TIGR01720 family)
MGRRTHLLDINCHVGENQLRVAWHYCEQVHLRSTVERLVGAFIDALRVIIGHSQSSTVRGYTPSDFPDVELSQEQIEKIISEMF